MKKHDIKVREYKHLYTHHIMFYRVMDILQTIDQQEEEVLPQGVDLVDDLEDLVHLVGAALLLPCQEEVDEVKEGVRKKSCSKAFSTPSNLSYIIRNLYDDY